MARKVKPIISNRIYYKLNHPLVGETLIFDSWMTVCEFALDLAEEETKKRQAAQFNELFCSIADEIVDTAEEYEPETTD